MLFVPDEDGVAAGEQLLRSYFGMHRFEWPDDDSVEFHLGHGEMIQLLRDCGFDVEQLIEIRPPEGSTTRYPFVTLEWARRWPCKRYGRRVGGRWRTREDSPAGRMNGVQTPSATQVEPAHSLAGKSVCRELQTHVRP